LTVPARRDPVVWLGLGAGVVLLAWSMRAILADPLHTIWGQSIDAIHAYWVVWWKQQDPTVAWVDFPQGATGPVLPPLGMAVASRAAVLLGSPLAYSLFCAASIGFDLAALCWLTWRLSASARAAAVVPLLFLTARPALAQVAMGNPESVAVGWLCLALAVGIAWARPSERKPSDSLRSPNRELLQSALVGSIFAISVIENPYTLVPGGIAALLLALRRLRQPGGLGAVALAAVCGAALVGVRLAAVGGRPGGTLLPNAMLTWRGLQWQMYDIQTLYAQHLLWPWPLPHLEATQEAIAAADAHHFLGWTLVLLAILGIGRRTAFWWLGALGNLALALGSAPWGNPGPPGPFLLLNQGLSVIIAPVTQPERFLVFAVMSLSIPAGLGLVRLARWAGDHPRLRMGLWVGVIGLVTTEAFVWGGPAMEVPTLSTRPVACLAELPAGPVFTLGNQHETGEDAAAGMFLQTVHQQPGTHHGLGGWPTSEVEAHHTSIREALLDNLGGGRRDRPKSHMLRDLRCVGVAHALIRDEQLWPGLPQPTVQCGGWSAIPLEDRIGGECHEPRTLHQSHGSTRAMLPE
jgi:hypothetical protein